MHRSERQRGVKLHYVTRANKHVQAETRRDLMLSNDRKRKKKGRSRKSAYGVRERDRRPQREHQMLCGRVI